MNFQKNIKRYLCIIMVSLTIILSAQMLSFAGIEFSNPFKMNTLAASVVKSWSYNEVSKLSSSDAQIKATVNLSKSVKISKAGFYIGTSKNNLKKNAKSDTVNKSYKSLPMWYLMSKYGEKLKENTTYYYKFYVIIDGKYYYSAVKNFKTKASSSSSSIGVTWSYDDVSKLSTNDAQIGATVKLSKSAKIGQAGFYIGTSEGNLKKNSTPDTVNKSYTSLPMWFLMSKYEGKLAADTTYYYKFYVTVDNKEYCSVVKSFKTKAVPITVSWYTNVNSINTTDAKIEANASTSETVSVTDSGFYIGIDSNNMKKYSLKLSKVYTDTNIPFSFVISKYLTLTPGTQYFYKVYFVADGKTYYSPVSNFTTKYAEIEGKPTCQFTHYNAVKISDITSTSAKITLTENFNKKVTVSEYGLYIGTSKENIKKSSKVNKVKSTNAKFTYTYTVAEYAKLKKNTKYYFQTYIVADGKTYKSQVKNFTTANTLTWPALDRGLNNVTQGYHKGCIDIGGSKQTVVAAMGGTVYKYYLCNKSHVPKKQGGDGKGANASCCYGFGNGLIVKGDDGRYYQYAHMDKNSIPKALRKKGARVNEGQTIGKIGNTGYSFGAHLHFGISTTTKFTNSKVDPMLEKYNNIDVDYFKKISVSNIKKNDAKITANIVNTKVSKVGFYIGTGKTSMKKYSEKYNGKLKTFYYPLKKWCGSLKANTKYYYKFYIVVNGKEIASDIKSFTTKK